MIETSFHKKVEIAKSRYKNVNLKVLRDNFEIIFTFKTGKRTNGRLSKETIIIWLSSQYNYDTRRKQWVNMTK